ncbi:MAG: type II secretion system protein [Patescibacteria group bacterium]
MIKQTDKKGFTLIEILIATTIFATVMLIAVAIISSSVDYRTKLRELRRTSEDTTKIADIITQDIREAKGNTKGVTVAGSVFTKGVVTLLCDPGSCTLENDGSANIKAANTLITFSENSYSITTGFEGIAYYKKENVALAGVSTAAGVLALWRNTVGFNQTSSRTQLNIINQNGDVQDFETTIAFNGFAGSTGFETSKYQQHFIRFLVYSETKDYDQKLPGGRAKAQIKSSVALRNYH